MTSAIATRETFESLRREDPVGEWWSARDLMFPLGYDRWERFNDAIVRAQMSAGQSGVDVPDHFRGAAKKVEIGHGVERVVVDYRLSRFGAYLVAMNGDPRKPEIAAAQTYFAVQTRRAEIGQRREPSRLELIDMAREAELERIAEQERREIAEAKVAELEPVAAVARDLIDASGDYSVREAAQVLCRAGVVTGERRLFERLRQLGWIQDANRAYQRHLEAGRVRVRTGVIYDRHTGEPHVTTQIRLTGKGVSELHRILGGNQPLELVRGAS